MSCSHTHTYSLSFLLNESTNLWFICQWCPGVIQKVKEETATVYAKHTSKQTKCIFSERVQLTRIMRRTVSIFERFIFPPPRFITQWSDTIRVGRPYDLCVWVFMSLYRFHLIVHGIQETWGLRAWQAGSKTLYGPYKLLSLLLLSLSLLVWLFILSVPHRFWTVYMKYIHLHCFLVKNLFSPEYMMKSNGWYLFSKSRQVLIGVLNELISIFRSSSFFSLPWLTIQVFSIRPNDGIRYLKPPHGEYAFLYLRNLMTVLESHDYFNELHL